ncbi:MAG: MoaD/ThiS family protein [Bacillota bacterium]
MQVKVRLFATLREGRGKEVMVDLPDGGTAQNIIESLKIAREDVAILLINGRDGRLDTQLAGTDVVSIFPPVGGG